MGIQDFYPTHSDTLTILLVVLCVVWLTAIYVYRAIRARRRSK